MINKEVNCTASLAIQMALEKLYKDFKLYKVGESEYGFYVDFFINEKISSNDFLKINKEINKIVAGGYKIEILDNKDSIEFKKNNSILLNYKLFKINNKIYPTYNEPLTNTNKIKSTLLTQIGGVEFNDGIDNLQLIRINGSSFINNNDLENFKKLQEELKLRDHRKIGEDLKIFTFNEDAGLGFPIWLPNGNYIKEKISNYLKTSFINYGFKLISTPILGSKKLYQTSGHWDLYKENNFPPIKIDNESFMLRPMTCPHHMLVFNSIPKSYRDLPYKISEDSKLHRYESSGGLIGLERVRAMELFDTHIFCNEEMIEEIILELNEIIVQTYEKLNIKIDRVDLSLKSNDKDKYFDDPNMWKKSEDQLRKILKKMKYDFHEIEGEAAFYGPKIDYQYKTILGKWITISTIQLDFLLPKKFECKYKDKNGELTTPILIHFGVVGTYERLISVLLSQTKGVLPLWLNPIQIVIMPINNNFHLDYANKVKEILLKNNFQVELNDSNDRLSKKIRDAQTTKIPFQIIIGDDEVKSGNNISYRKYGEQDTTSISSNEFITILKDKV